MKNKYSYLAVTFLLALCSCKEAMPTKAEFTLISLEEPVEFHTDLQLDGFINKSFEDVCANTDYVPLAQDRPRGTNCSYPDPIRLSWSVTTDKGSLSSYQVHISEKEDMSEPYIMKTSKKYVDFYNAKVNQEYFYQVTSGKFTSEIGNFITTNKGPRNIYVDGVINVRDLGGYGGIKQGLLYRGAAFESVNEDSKKVVVNITKKGKDTLINKLGIKTEVDVRRNVEYKSVIENCSLSESSVSGLNYVALPMHYGGYDVLTYKGDLGDNPASIKSFLNLLADPNSYPIYFHCSQGKDRTGGLSYLLGALMGLDKESLYRDYLFSNFASIWEFHQEVKDIENRFGDTLASYKSDETSLTLQQRTYAYINEAYEIPSSTIDKIIENLSE